MNCEVTKVINDSVCDKCENLNPLLHQLIHTLVTNIMDYTIQSYELLCPMAFFDTIWTGV